jgi:hypothetical protein
MFYLGWLSGGELFDADLEDLVVTSPEEAATWSLPPGIGLIELSLLPETKSDSSKMADVVIAYCTLLGLNLGKWASRLAYNDSFIPSRLFSSADYPTWTSHIFCKKYACPLVEAMRVQGEPTLKMFSEEMGKCICGLLNPFLASFGSFSGLSQCSSQ